MPWLPKRKIVVPLDFSDFSIAALKVALELVEDPSCLYAIHVLPHLSPMEPGVVWGEVNDQSRHEQAVKSMKQRIAQDYDDRINIEVALGEPAKQVAKYAQELEAELIVIHSHGRTGARHILIGSVAERVVRHAHCPVLIIRE